MWANARETQRDSVAVASPKGPTVGPIIGARRRSDGVVLAIVCMTLCCLCDPASTEILSSAFSARNMVRVQGGGVGRRSGRHGRGLGPGPRSWPNDEWCRASSKMGHLISDMGSPTSHHAHSAGSQPEYSCSSDEFSHQLQRQTCIRCNRLLFTDRRHISPTSLAAVLRGEL